MEYKKDKMLKFFDFKLLLDINSISIDGNTKVINTINAHSYCVSKKNLLFKQALIQSDALIPDGMGIVVIARIIYGKKIDRITGWDLHDYLLKLANKKKGNVFYFGSKADLITKIIERVKKRYPYVNVNGFSPPYKEMFDKQENEEFIKKINSYNPDVLFLGMTAPKQEIWAFLNKNALNAKVIASIGAVFDYYAGRVKRAPLILQKAGLEWLFRSLMEPKRLGKRNIESNPKYLFYILCDILKGKK